MTRAALSISRGYADLCDKEWLIRDFDDEKVQSLMTIHGDVWMY